MSTCQNQVIEVKDSLFRGKQSGQALQDVINDQATIGRRLLQIMSEDIKGRMGIGSTSGVVILFEWQTS